MPNFSKAWVNEIIEYFRFWDSRKEKQTESCPPVQLSTVQIILTKSESQHQKGKSPSTTFQVSVPSGRTGFTFVVEEINSPNMRPSALIIFLLIRFVMQDSSKDNYFGFNFDYWDEIKYTNWCITLNKWLEYDLPNDLLNKLNLGFRMYPNCD